MNVMRNVGKLTVLAILAAGLLVSMPGPADAGPDMGHR